MLGTFGPDEMELRPTGGEGLFSDASCTTGVLGNVRATLSVNCFPEKRRFDTNLFCTAISVWSDVGIVVPLYVLCFEKIIYPTPSRFPVFQFLDLCRGILLAIWLLGRRSVDKRVQQWVAEEYRRPKSSILLHKSRYLLQLHGRAFSANSTYVLKSASALQRQRSHEAYY
jgi:hypothetical protein